MGDVIDLTARRTARGAAMRRGRCPARPVVAEFFFDLACPFSYLATEPVDRAFDEVRWTPASLAALQRTTPGRDRTSERAARAAAGERAHRLGAPLVWPERWPRDVLSAMRAAAYAGREGRGGPFVLAAGRLAWCGGFDLDDPETLAEAAGAARLPFDDVLRAARDAGWDEVMAGAARRLVAGRVRALPALRVGRSLVWGEEAVARAAAAARLRAATGR